MSQAENCRSRRRHIRPVTACQPHPLSPADDGRLVCRGNRPFPLASLAWRFKESQPQSDQGIGGGANAVLAKEPVRGTGLELPWKRAVIDRDQGVAIEPAIEPDQVWECARIELAFDVADRFRIEFDQICRDAVDVALGKRRENGTNV